jgi:hypothetical protein
MRLDTKTYWLTDRQFQFLSDNDRVLSSEFSVEDSHLKFVVWRLGVWFDDFNYV